MNWIHAYDIFIYRNYFKKNLRRRANLFTGKKCQRVWKVRGTAPARVIRIFQAQQKMRRFFDDDFRCFPLLYIAKLKQASPFVRARIDSYRSRRRIKLEKFYATKVVELFRVWKKKISDEVENKNKISKQK